MLSNALTQDVHFFNALFILNRIWLNVLIFSLEFYSQLFDLFLYCLGFFYAVTAAAERKHLERSYKEQNSCWLFPLWVSSQHLYNHTMVSELWWVSFNLLQDFFLATLDLQSENYVQSLDGTGFWFKFILYFGQDANINLSCNTADVSSFFDTEKAELWHKKVKLKEYKGADWMNISTTAIFYALTSPFLAIVTHVLWGYSYEWITSVQLLKIITMGGYLLIF